MPDTIILIATIALLIAVNGLYVAAEFAIIGVRIARLREMADQGVAAARRVLAIADSPTRVDGYISTSQVGITVASLGLGMYAEERLLHMLEGPLSLVPIIPTYAAAWFIAISVLTYLHIVLGEMLPKAYALAKPEATAFRIELPMRLSLFLFRPLVVPLMAIGNGFLKLIKVPIAPEGTRILTPDEIELVISQSAAGGLLTERQGRILLSIFDFGEREVHEVMTPRTRIEAVPVGITEDELTAQLISSRRSRLPVYDGDLDNIVGILYLKDLVRWRVDGHGRFDVRRLSRRARLIPEHMPVEKLLEVFKREHGHIAIVIDEFGGTAGLVTLEDLAEEIVGEVRDVDEPESLPVEVIGPGNLLVRGDVLLDTLREYVDLGSDLPAVDTVGGLVVTLLGRPADRGDQVEIGNVLLTVQRVRRLAVERVRVTPLELGGRA